MVDHGGAVLGPFSEGAHEYAAKALERDGVELRMGTGVEEVGPGHVRADRRHHHQDALRRSGAGGSPRPRWWRRAACPRGAGAGWTCSPTSRSRAIPASTSWATCANIAGHDGAPLPQLGSVALQSGTWAAKNIVADLAGKERDALQVQGQGHHGHDRPQRRRGRGGQAPPRGARHVAFVMWLGVHAALMSGVRTRRRGVHRVGLGRVLAHPVADRSSTAPTPRASTGARTRNESQPTPSAKEPGR